MRLSILILILASLVALRVAAENRSEVLDGYARFVHEDGSLHFSPDSLRGFAHLGSWFVPAGDAAGFHNVYTQPEAIAAYRETGRFPDGTALVKEIASDRRGAYTTGNDVAHATQVRRWFLMVKDSQGQFAESPLWGKGWGWALFESEAPSKNIAIDHQADCLGCHAPAQQTDWIYVEGYPALGTAQDCATCSAGSPMR